jgi:hypothetical protein
MSITWMLRMTVLDSVDGVSAPDCDGAPCAWMKAGVPRKRAAMMTDAVRMRMVKPFQFE